MEQIHATQAARRLSDRLNPVPYQGASFELTRGGQRSARLVPVGPPKEVKVSALNELFARLPDYPGWERIASPSNATFSTDKRHSIETETLGATEFG